MTLSVQAPLPRSRIAPYRSTYARSRRATADAQKVGEFVGVTAEFKRPSSLHNVILFFSIVDTAGSSASQESADPPAQESSFSFLSMSLLV